MALPMLSPSLLGTLQNTLTPAGVLTLWQAQQDEQQRQLNEAASKASDAASSAGQAYQSAAAQPTPEVDPLTQVITRSAGNVASVIGGNPIYRENATRSLDQMHADLVASRLQNLTALKNGFDLKAAAAEKAQNLAGTLEARGKSEQLAKTIDVLLQKQREQAATDLQDRRHQDTMAEIAGRGEQARTTKGTTPGKAPTTPKPGFDAGGNYDISNMVKTTASGRRYVDLGALTGDAKNAAVAAANAQKIAAPDQASVAGIKDVDRARRDISKLQDYVLPLVPHDAQGRLGGFANRRISSMSQTDPARAAFRVWADAAIPILRATAGSKNLRITQEQVKLAISNIPTQNDTWGTVLKKVAILNALLDNAEAPLIDTNWTPAGRGSTDEFSDPSLQKR